MKYYISQILNRWIGDDLRIILPEAIHQNVDFSSRNIDFPFSDHHIFSGNFREISGKFFQKFSGKILFSHLYTLSTPHITHPHPISQTVNSLRTSNPLFSKCHFQCICTFISHTLHIYSQYNILYTVYCMLIVSS